MRRFIKGLKTNPTFLIGTIIIVLFILIAAFAPLIAPYSFFDRVPEDNPRYIQPCAKYLFGTDKLGRDLFSRVIYGTPYALKVCLIISSVSIVLGLFFGLTSGYYYGTAWDSFVQFIVITLMSIPAIVLVVAIVGAIGRSLDNVILAFAIVGWSGTARMVRAKTQVVIGMPFVEAAKAFGERDIMIIIKYVLPNIASTLIVMFTMSMPGALLGTAAISFLGLADTSAVPEWGTLINEGWSQLSTAPWMAIFPGVVLTIVALGINWFGEGLRDIFDLTNK